MKHLIDPGRLLRPKTAAALIGISYGRLIQQLARRHSWRRWERCVLRGHIGYKRGRIAVTYSGVLAYRARRAWWYSGNRGSTLAIGEHNPPAKPAPNP